MRNRNKKEEQNRYANEYREVRCICKCGKRMPIPVYKDEIRCSWCGRTVKNSSRLYFKNKLMEAINRLEIEGEKR